MKAEKFKKKISNLLLIPDPSKRNKSILKFLKIRNDEPKASMLSILNSFEYLKEKAFINENELVQVFTTIITLLFYSYNFIKRPRPIIPDRLDFSTEELKDLEERANNSYRDPMNLIPDLKLYFDLIHYLFSNEEFELVSILGYPALISEVYLELDRFRSFNTVESPGYKSIESIILSSNLPLDVKGFIKEIVTSYFLTHKAQNSPETIEEILINYNNSYENLESLIPVLNIFDEELKDFLFVWINYLLEHGKDFRDTSLSYWSRVLHHLNLDEKLLNEALKLLNDSAYYEKFVLEHLEDHPDLYAYYLIEEVQNKDKKVSLAKKAFQKLEENPDIRKRILKEITSLTSEDQNEELNNELILEEFYVYPSFIRYMELIENNLVEKPEVREKISRIIKMDPSKFFWNEEKSQFPLLMLLNRDFAQVMKILNEATELYGDERENIPLMLTLILYLLYQGEELPESLNKKIEYIDRFYFHNDKYISLKDQSSNLKELLAKWKSNIPEEEIDEDWLVDIHKFSVKHLNKLKKKYLPLIELDTIAHLIAMLGEVLESRNLTTKQDYMEKFRDRYAEDQDFIESLENFGLKK